MAGRLEVIGWAIVGVLKGKSGWPRGRAQCTDELVLKNRPDACTGCTACCNSAILLRKIACPFFLNVTATRCAALRMALLVFTGKREINVCARLLPFYLEKKIAWPIFLCITETHCATPRMDSLGFSEKGRIEVAPADKGSRLGNRRLVCRSSRPCVRPSQFIEFRIRRGQDRLRPQRIISWKVLKDHRYRSLSRYWVSNLSPEEPAWLDCSRSVGQQV